MARTIIDMSETLADTTTSVGKVMATGSAISSANGAKINDFFNVKDNSAYVVLDVTTAGEVILKAGDAYPTQNILGDLRVQVETGFNIIQIERHGRFENRDKSLDLDFSDATAGTIYAFGKHAGLAPVENQ